MHGIRSKLSSAATSAGTGFEHRAAGSCPVAKRISENPDWISDLRDFSNEYKDYRISKFQTKLYRSGLNFEVLARFPPSREFNLPGEG